ncbi:MAG: transposase [candidate division WS1 bacterium]|nr:transposase [candidate division WS1 bacterium]
MSQPPPNPASDLPNRKHLRRLPVAFMAPPIYLVTVCVLERRKVLAEQQMAEMVISLLKETSERHGWLVGRYVVMPDHVHLFCSPVTGLSSLGTFVGGFKESSTRAAWTLGWEGRLWQHEFHDHLLRSAESYGQKWHYVLLNPVRRGLCSQPEEWPYQGQIEAF